MDCKTRGVPYMAARHEDIDDTYNPASSKTSEKLQFLVICNLKG